MKPLSDSEVLPMIPDRFRQGRYRLADVVDILVKSCGEDPTLVLDKLISAVHRRDLPVYLPGQKMRYNYGEPDGQCEASIVRLEHEEVYWHELNDWLAKCCPKIAFRFFDPGSLKHFDRQSKGSGDSRRVVPGANGVTPDCSETWIEVARRLASEYLKRHRDMDLFPSQHDVCAHVAEAMRNARIFGHTGKPLLASYIQRNAIQGEWWKDNYRR